MLYLVLVFMFHQSTNYVVGSMYFISLFFFQLRELVIYFIFMFDLIYCSIIRKTLKGRKQTKMKGGQSGTYLRQTRALSGLRVSIAKTYRDETKMNILAK